MGIGWAAYSAARRSGRQIASHSRRAGGLSVSFEAWQEANVIRAIHEGRASRGQVRWYLKAKARSARSAEQRSAHTRNAQLIADGAPYSIKINPHTGAIRVTVSMPAEKSAPARRPPPVARHRQSPSAPPADSDELRRQSFRRSMDEFIPKQLAGLPAEELTATLEHFRANRANHLMATRRGIDRRQDWEPWQREVFVESYAAFMDAWTSGLE